MAAPYSPPLQGGLIPERQLPKRGKVLPARAGAITLPGWLRLPRRLLPPSPAEGAVAGGQPSHGHFLCRYRFDLAASPGKCCGLPDEAITDCIRHGIGGCRWARTFDPRHRTISPALPAGRDRTHPPANRCVAEAERRACAERARKRAIAFPPGPVSAAGNPSAWAFSASAPPDTFRA